MELDSEVENKQGITINQLIPKIESREDKQGIAISQSTPSFESIPMSMTSPPEFNFEKKGKRLLDLPFLALMALAPQKKEEISPKTSPMMISPTTEPKRRISKTLPYERPRKSVGAQRTSPKSISSATVKNVSPVLADNLVSRSRSTSSEKEISSSNEEIYLLSKEMPLSSMEISSSSAEQPLNSSQLVQNVSAVPHGWAVKRVDGKRRFSLEGEDRRTGIDLVPKDHIKDLSEPLQKEILEMKRDISPLRQRAESPIESKETRRDGSITPQRERGGRKSMVPDLDKSNSERLAQIGKLYTPMGAYCDCHVACRFRYRYCKGRYEITHNGAYPVEDEFQDSYYADKNGDFNEASFYDHPYRYNTPKDKEEITIQATLLSIESNVSNNIDGSFTLSK